MEIKFYCTRWGFEDVPWEPFLNKVKEAGYSGIEWFPFGEKTDYWDVIKLMKERGLEFSIVMTVIDEPQDFHKYTEALGNQLRSLSAIRTEDLSASFITAQTGREFYTEDEVDTCIDVCNKISARTGIPIYHETHRNKWAYAAYKVLPHLKKNNDLLLTFDVSHWFCVAESYLADQQAAINQAILHTRHVHARVGYTQGPQVWDPAAPEYRIALDEHLKIWDKWVHQRDLDGDVSCTFTPEFGPPPYMVRGNRNDDLQQEQWRLNLWMKSLLEQRYKNNTG